MPRWVSRSMKISETTPSSRSATFVSCGVVLTIRSLVMEGPFHEPSSGGWTSAVRVRKKGSLGIGVAGGEIAQLGLAPLLVALPEEAARAHRDLRLDLVVTRALRIQVGVEERVDACPLVVLEVGPGEPGREEHHQQQAEHG